MKEVKKSILLLYILFALPVPISALSWLGTLMSIASIGMIDWSNFSEVIQLSVALITMVLAGSYILTYIYSLRITLKNNRLSFISILPILHIAITIIGMIVWSRLNELYQI